MVSNSASTRRRDPGRVRRRIIRCDFQVRQPEFLFRQLADVEGLDVVGQTRLPDEFDDAFGRNLAASDRNVSKRRAFGVITEQGR